MRTKIRSARPDEARGLEDLARRTIRAYAEHPRDEPTVFDGLHRGQLTDHDVVLVAEDRDNPGPVVGIAVAFPLEVNGRLITDVGKLSVVAVEPAHQRQGIGARLVRRLIAELRLREYRVLYGAYDTADGDLYGFYGALGFDALPVGVPLDIREFTISAECPTDRHFFQNL